MERADTFIESMHPSRSYQAPFMNARDPLWFYSFLSKFRLLSSYRAKIMVMAFVGTHVPLISLAVYFAIESSQETGAVLRTIGVTLVATLVGTAVTLVVLNQLLRPVLMTSRSLRAFRDDRKVSSLPTKYKDEVGTLMADADGTIGHLDVMLETMEFRDEITVRPNRKRFLDLVSTRIQNRRATAVVVIRFDNLPRIAESLNHLQADQAVRMLSERFSLRSEFGDHLSRIDALHFACILGARRDDRTPWVDAIGRVRAAIEACSEELVLGTVSVLPILRGGPCAFPEDGEDPSVLLDHSISAAARATALQPVSPHSGVARKDALRRFTLEQELRRAIKEDQFELAFQPVVNVQVGRAVGAEALVRWRHPERGLIAPGEFIPVAESSGLIESIGLWVLRSACAEVSRWNHAGRNRLRMAINLSARQFHDPKLLSYVREAIEANHISADQLEIELTETAAMVDHDHTRKVFTALRDMGAGISIDDFGTARKRSSRSATRRSPCGHEPCQGDGAQAAEACDAQLNEETVMIKYIHAATLAAMLACLTMASPAMALSDAADATIDRAEAQYKAAKEKCDDLKGNQEDVCKEQAKANYEKVKADAKAQDKGTPAARKDAVEDKAKADYKVAKEKCDALKGQQEDACEAQAKADYERALATVKK